MLEELKDLVEKKIFTEVKTSPSTLSLMLNLRRKRQSILFKSVLHSRPLL
jgi:hypothetical protein